jgi:hypothetical protein
MEARVPKVARVSAGFSKSLARRPLSSEPEEGALDHPAAQQDDKALHVVGRLTISMHSGGTFATAPSTCQTL